MGLLPDRGVEAMYAILIQGGMMEERIDFFGKYLENITDIHDSFFNDISFSQDIDKSQIERSLIQCNYSEYIAHHPEEPEYYFDLYDFRFNGHTGPIMTAFNEFFFKKRDDYSRVINSLSHSWTKSANCSFTFLRNGQNIDDLGFGPYDMMLTAHFIYMNKEWFGRGINLQLFKIIYPYKTLEPFLRSLD